MKTFAGYPLGEQSFEYLRGNNLLYVDKTRFVEEIVRPGGKYYFLARPRRFGKSLFLSTLECFFKGRRELFKGLYADTMAWDWEPHPVLYFDLNIQKYKSERDLTSVVNNMMKKWEGEYDVVPDDPNLPVRFANVIEAAYKKTGKGVVILVDEYDKPLVNNLHQKQLMDSFRDELAAIYSNFKSSAKYIRLVFITGVSRFAHLSVFSGLNNLRDISFSTPYSDICGITFDELKEYFQPGIQDLAEAEGLTPEQTILKIKEWYDGYRFCPKGKEIYNPFSVLNLMQELEFRDYWVQTGQPTVLMEQISRFDVNLEELLNSECALSKLYGLDLDTPGMQALFYQTGYLTIKDYDREFQTVKLRLPNQEVSNGFFSYLLPYYHRQSFNADTELSAMVKDLRQGHANDFMRHLQGFFADISYELQMESENNFQNAFYILIRLLGLYVEAERRTSDGRIDIFIGTPKYYYIIELKKDATAEAAMQQIHDKQYELPFAMGNRQLICIGASFSTETCTITDWLLGC